MKVVSVINSKGGVGKTTVVSNIAAYAAATGKRVLMIDVDPQTNLTFSFIDHPYWGEHYAENQTLQNFFRPIVRGSKKKISLESLIIPLDVLGVKIDLIASHLELLDIDVDLAANLGGANVHQLANNYLIVHNYLKEGIAELKDRYDLILIDCAPSFSVVTRNALTASENYLVPSKMDYLSTFGIQQLTRNSRKFVQRYNEYARTFGDEVEKIDPQILGVVATMLGIQNGVPIKANQYYLNYIQNGGYRCFDSYLRDNKTCYSTAPSNRVPLVFSQDSNPAVQIIVAELKALGKEFLEKAGI
jgi:chromosome partitioning protein